MKLCVHCEQPLYNCICRAVAKFFKGVGHLIRKPYKKVG